MREQANAFHLAIPTYDLGEAARFYVDVLGCRVARCYDDRITLDFFGDQVVCHLTSAPAVRAEPAMYPRHFGVTFRDSADFEALLEACIDRQASFFAPLSVRFSGRREAHRTFVLRDPSDNLIEFKHYDDPAMMY